MKYDAVIFMINQWIVQSIQGQNVTQNMKQQIFVLISLTLQVSKPLKL